MKPFAIFKRLQQISLHPLQTQTRNWREADQTAEPSVPIKPSQNLKHLKPAKVLVVLAHPDDEVLLSGTVSQLAKAKSVQFVYVTSGENGRDVSGLDLKHSALGWAREKEQQSALKVLGIQREPVFLRHADGNIQGEASQVRTDLATVIHAVRPEVILTFGPDGFTGHPDHIAVGGITHGLVQQLKQQRRFSIHAYPTPQLFHMGLSDEGFKHFRESFDDPLDESWVDVKPMQDASHLVKVAIPAGLASQKLLAIASHRTQFAKNELESFKRFQQQFPYETFEQLDVFA